MSMCYLCQEWKVGSTMKISVMHHISRKRQRLYVNINIHKNTDKMKCHDESKKQTRNIKELPQSEKGIYKKSTSCLIVKD